MHKILPILGILLVSMLLIIVACAPAPTPRPFPPPPSEAPTPTPPPAPQLSSAEQAYATTIADQAITVGDTLTKLGELLQSPQFGNEDWTLTTALGLSIIRMAYNEAMEIEPPDSMAHIHYKYVQAMKHFNTMTELLAQGIDESDPDLLNEAIAEMETGTQLINETTRLMKEFIKAHSK